MLKRIGVYKIRNTVNGKIYIGSTNVSFGMRFSQHKHALRRNKHHSPRLQAAWKKHGADAFIFEPIVVCRREDTIETEQRILDAFKPFYNMSPTAGGNAGRPVRRTTVKNMLKAWHRRAPRHEFRGEMLTAREIADLIEMDPKVISRRISQGMKGEELVQPVHDFANGQPPKMKEVLQAKWPRYDVKGEALTIKEIAEKYDLPMNTIRWRLKQGANESELLAPEGDHIARYEVRGEFLTVTEISEKYGIDKGTISFRIRSGKRDEGLVAPDKRLKANKTYTRPSKFYEHKGEMLTADQIAVKYNLSRSCIFNRLNKGIRGDALTAPAQRRKKEATS